MMALEMLSACSHRWQTAKFDLFCDWQPDNVGPWEKDYGWILPWTQLTKLILTFNEDFAIENDDVPNLLPMLHNIKELRFSLQFPPTLSSSRGLKPRHYAKYTFGDYQQWQIEPVDVHEQIFSLIQRSSCRIRKLSIGSNRQFYVGTLNDVEELVIDYLHASWIRSSIDISSLQQLRLLTIVCWIDDDDDFKSSMNSLTTALESARVPTRRERSSGTPIGLLERVMVEGAL
ncbi:hypothetical protein JOM56_015445 [Amanita muscaria]